MIARCLKDMGSIAEKSKMGNNGGMNKDGTPRGERINRRDFLKILTLVGFGGVGLGIYERNPLFWKKVYRSLMVGKVLQDAEEALKSRFTPDTRKMVMKEKLTGYQESWMPEVCDNFDVFGIEGLGGAVGFFNVTSTCNIIQLQNKQIPENAMTQHPINTYDLSSEMVRRKQMTLPLPQTEYPMTQMGTTNPPAEEYRQYDMYAGFRVRGRRTTSAMYPGVDPQPSRKRGGAILSQDGKLIVATPDEFVTFDFELDKLQAQIEYAYIVDSNTLDADIRVLEGSPGFKDIAMTSEYENCLVTFYDENGEFQTHVMSLFTTFDEERLTPGTAAPNVNVVQLLDFVNQYAIKNGFRRFVVAIPDGSTLNHLTTPAHYKLSEIKEKLPEKSIPDWVMGAENATANGADCEVFRQLGSGSMEPDGGIEIFSSPNFGAILPIMITSSKSR